MGSELNSCPMDKQRLREDIAEQIQQFIASGGRVHQVESTAIRVSAVHPSPWETDAESLDLYR